MPGGGKTNSAPCAVVYLDGLRLLVKGLDNSIYINSNGGGKIPIDAPEPPPIPTRRWSGWNKYPDGQTKSGPAVTQFNGQLVTLVRGMDDGIYLKNGLRIGWTQLEGATIGSPALESFQGSLYAMVRGTDNGIYINRFGGRSWIGWSKLDGATFSGGTLVSDERSLYAIIRGTDNAIYVNRMESWGAWSGWENIGGGTSAEPAAAIYHGTLYVAVRGTGK